MKSDKKLFAGE